MLDLVAESWTWYGLAMLLVISRFVARYLTLGGFKKYQAEDFVMMLVVCLYTIEIVLLNIVAETPTNLIAPEDLGKLTADDVDERVYGSKLVVALEQVYCAGIWGCKACILLMYANLTFGLKQYTMVKIVAVYAAVTYVTMTILYLGVWCRPLSNYWSVPAESPQCSAATNHLITNMVFNVSSDILMMAIPLPILIKLRIGIGKKIVLVGLFSVGLFVIVSSILNKYYSFTNPYGSEWTFWYTREISCAVMVANIPHAWTLIRKAFKLRSFLSGSQSSNRTPPTDSFGAALADTRRRSQRISTPNPTATSRPMMIDNTYHSRNGSGDFITVPVFMQPPAESEPPVRNVPLEIWQDQEFSLQVENASEIDLKKNRNDSLESSDIEAQVAPIQPAHIIPDGMHTTITSQGRQ